MRSRVLVSGLIVVLLLFPFLVAEAPAEDGLSIGRMRVMIWPEYDDPSVLVVYDGRFTDDSRFPTVTDFIIPKGAIINDVCSLSPGGQHFCQLYDVSAGDRYDTVHLSLPFSNFYVSFHLAPIDLETAERRIEYVIKANHPIARMEVDIQQPLRSTKFAISPSGGAAYEEKDFNHFAYTLDNVAKGEDRVFEIGYVKETKEPSVDVKFASMTGRRVWGSPYDTQRKVRTIIYVVFGTGVTMMLAAILWIVSRRRSKGVTAGAGVEPVRRWHRLFKASLLAVLVLLPGGALALTVGEVAKDLACPCECPLILEDCNMTCGLDWKEEIGEMVKAGKTKQEIMDYFIATYGEEARLTTMQRIDGKIFQYTRGFGTTDWVMLWLGVAFWALVLTGGIYYGVRRYFIRAPV